MSELIKCCEVVHQLVDSVSIIKSQEENRRIIEAIELFPFIITSSLKVNNSLCSDCLRIYKEIENRWKKRGWDTEKLDKETQEIKKKISTMTEAEISAEILKDKILKGQKRKKEIDKQDTRLIECCDLTRCLGMIFNLQKDSWEKPTTEGWSFIFILDFASSYFKMRSKLCEKCLTFYERTTSQMPERERTEKMLEEGKRQFGIEEDFCIYCRKEIINFKEPIVVHNSGLKNHISYYHLNCYKDNN